MKNWIMVLLLVIPLTLSCQKRESSAGDPVTAAAATLSPEQLGELGAKIKKNPDQAQRLLSEAGLTEESFEQAIRRVTEDAEASKRYAAAYRKELRAQG